MPTARRPCKIWNYSRQRTFIWAFSSKRNILSNSPLGILSASPFKNELHDFRACVLYFFVPWSQGSVRIPPISAPTAPFERIHLVLSTTTCHCLAKQASNRIAHDALDAIPRKIQILSHILGFYSKLSWNISAIEVGHITLGI